MIHQADKQLKTDWLKVFSDLPEDSKSALRAALISLRADALIRSQHCWKKHKAPMALYWKVVGVYAGHLSKSLKNKA